MRFFLFVAIVGIVLFVVLWWGSIGPARHMSSEIRTGMSTLDVMESGTGWISCTLQSVSKDRKRDGAVPSNFIEITSPANASVNATSSSFPEDRPVRKWPSRRQFAGDLEKRIKSSNAPWEAKFVFTGIMNRSNFVVIFTPEGKVAHVSRLHMDLAAPDFDFLRGQ